MRRALRAQGAHRKKLQHPVLHIAEGVVIGVENPARLRKVKALIGAVVPRQFGDVFEIGPDDLRLHRLATDAAQAPELPIDFLAGVLRQHEGLEPLFELIDFTGLVLVTEFATNRLQLFAQVDLALTIAEFLLDLGLDLFLGIEHRDLPLHLHQHTAEPLVDCHGFEQRLALPGLEIEVAGHQVGKATRVVDAVEHLLHHLFREARLLPQLRGASTELLMECHERRIGVVDRREVLHRHHSGHQVAVFLGHRHGHPAPFAVEQELHPGHPALQLADPGDGPDGVQPFRRNPFDVLTLGDSENQLLGRGERGLDCLYGHRAAGANRRGHPGKEDNVPEGQDGEGQSFSHSGSPCQ